MKARNGKILVTIGTVLLVAVVIGFLIDFLPQCIVLALAGLAFVLASLDGIIIELERRNEDCDRS